MTMVKTTEPTIDLEAHVRTAMTRLSELETEIAGLREAEARLAFETLIGGNTQAAQRAADVEVAIAVKQQEVARLRAAIEEGGRRLSAEEDARRERERISLEAERVRAERVRDEHFGRVEKAVAMLTSAFEDSIAADLAVRQVETALGAPHAVFAGQRVGAYIGFHLGRARIPLALPPPPWDPTPLGRPLSVRGQAEAEKRQRALTQQDEGENA